MKYMVMIKGSEQAGPPPMELMMAIEELGKAAAAADVTVVTLCTTSSRNKKRSHGRRAFWNCTKNTGQVGKGRPRSVRSWNEDVQDVRNRRGGTGSSSLQFPRVRNRCNRSME